MYYSKDSAPILDPESYQNRAPLSVFDVSKHNDIITNNVIDSQIEITKELEHTTLSDCVHWGSSCAALCAEWLLVSLSGDDIRWTWPEFREEIVRYVMQNSHQNPASQTEVSVRRPNNQYLVNTLSTRTSSEHSPPQRKVNYWQIQDTNGPESRHEHRRSWWHKKFKSRYDGSDKEQREKQHNRVDENNLSPKHSRNKYLDTNECTPEWRPDSWRKVVCDSAEDNSPESRSPSIRVPYASDQTDHYKVYTIDLQESELECLFSDRAEKHHTTFSDMLGKKLSPMEDKWEIVLLAALHQEVVITVHRYLEHYGISIEESVVRSQHCGVSTEDSVVRSQHCGVSAGETLRFAFDVMSKRVRVELELHSYYYAHTFFEKVMQWHAQCIVCYVVVNMIHAPGMSDVTKPTTHQQYLDAKTLSVLIMSLPLYIRNLILVETNINIMAMPDNRRLCYTSECEIEYTTFLPQNIKACCSFMLISAH
ncbi:hypothetical protein PR048_010997 [Dryococelus australis]|uniref:Uncharacterized protein n=1 Tax=Dryococelus australis TaxID=614101 RepID=A0ABQ9HKE2_9NEOP|nr:hypothetical protein PR048_010997 [Dryococelus australis]